MNDTEFVEHLAALIEQARMDGVPADVVCRALEDFHAAIAPRDKADAPPGRALPYE